MDLCANYVRTFGVAARAALLFEPETPVAHVHSLPLAQSLSLP